jgi:glyceraldehyde-3-phosphate dehydrogenase/erythrose-4-phosphate dehydrogenase
LAFEKPEDIKNVVAELIRRLNEDRRMIKELSQDIERMRSSTSSLENAALAQMAEMRVTLEKMNAKVQDVAVRMNSVEATIARIVKDLSKTATRMEVKELQSFIDIVNPITSKFVTKDELERAFEEYESRKAAMARN